MVKTGIKLLISVWKQKRVNGKYGENLVTKYKFTSAFWRKSEC